MRNKIIIRTPTSLSVPPRLASIGLHTHNPQSTCGPPIASGLSRRPSVSPSIHTVIHLIHSFVARSNVPAQHDRRTHGPIPLRVLDSPGDLAKSPSAEPSRAGKGCPSRRQGRPALGSRANSNFKGTPRGRGGRLTCSRGWEKLGRLGDFAGDKRRGALFFGEGCVECCSVGHSCWEG